MILLYGYGYDFMDDTICIVIRRCALQNQRNFRPRSDSDLLLRSRLALQNHRKFRRRRRPRSDFDLLPRSRLHRPCHRLHRPP